MKRFMEFVDHPFEDEDDWLKVEKDYRLALSLLQIMFNSLVSIGKEKEEAQYFRDALLIYMTHSFNTNLREL